MPYTVDLRKQKPPKPNLEPIITAPIPAPQNNIQAPPNKSQAQKLKAPETNFHSKNVTWQTQIHHRRSSTGYFVGLIALLLISGGVIYYFQREVLLPIMLGLAAFTLILQTARKSEVVEAQVSQAGVTWAEQTHYYKDLHSFWIEYNPVGVRELSLRTKKWYLPRIKIPLESENPIQIRTIMIDFLPEEEHEEGLIDSLSRRI